MTKTEALKLAALLGLNIKSANDLADQVEAKGWQLALDTNGDWLVLDGPSELARVA